MRPHAAGSVRAALGPGAASRGCSASCGEVAASCAPVAPLPFAACDLTLRDAFALLVPMRTLSYALRQWFAEQSRSLQRSLPAAAELIASTAAKVAATTLRRTADCEGSLQSSSSTILDDCDLIEPPLCVSTLQLGIAPHRWTAGVGARGFWSQSSPPPPPLRPRRGSPLQTTSRRRRGGGDPSRVSYRRK